MSDTEPTVDQNAQPHTDQPGENTDADKVPSEFPQRPQGAFEHGTTVREQREGESLEDRLAREHPDTAPIPDPTATPLEADGPGGGGIDEEKDLVAERPLTEPHLDDSAHPDAGTPAEEAAVRMEDSDDVPGAVDRRPVRER